MLFMLAGCHNNLPKVSELHEITDTAEVRNIVEKMDQYNIDSAVTYAEAILVAETDFLNTLKTIDHESNQNNFNAFEKMLLKHKTSMYNLYLEYAHGLEIAYLDAVKKAESAQAKTGTGREDFFYIVYNQQLQQNLLSFSETYIKKYSMTLHQLRLFRKNYCNCSISREAKYCKDGRSIFSYGDYWMK